jgi:hypothetical protein
MWKIKSSSNGRCAPSPGRSTFGSTEGFEKSDDFFEFTRCGPDMPRANEVHFSVPNSVPLLY